MVKTTQILTIASLLLLSVGCNSSMDAFDMPLSEGGDLEGRVDVVLPIAGSSLTRTAIDPDDLSSVRWCVGDQVALWADGVESNDGNLTGEMFQLKYYGSTFDTADFSGSIYPMSDQYYDYHGFYPYTTAFSDKTVSYTIPSTQGGEYDGTLDFRVADCVRGEALNDIAWSRDFSLEFRSVTHALKITIPEGYNNLGYPVNKLVITMPANVVGNCSLDISDAEASPALTSGSSSITVDMGSETIDEGDTVWVFINPVSGVTGDIEIMGISSDDKWSYDYVIPVSNHTFEAGHVTPINTEIGEELPSTTLVVNISGNNLGESLTNINVTAPEGAIFVESGTNTISVSGTTSFKMSYITDRYGDKFKNASLTLELESEHALIPSTSLSLSSITENETNTFSREVPYLINQDFETMNSYVKNGFPTVGDSTTSDGDKDYVDLSEKGLTETGWTATRSASNGSVMSICCRSEMDTSSTLYEGRLNSPTIPYLKTGAKIKVTYDYDGSYYAREFYFYVFYWTWKDYKSGSVYYQRGYFTGDDPDADNDIANIVCEDGSTVYSSSESGKDMYVSNYWINSLVYSSSQSSTFYVSNATSSTRLAWRVWGSGRPDLGNANYCLYVDNVKVQIAN